MISKINKMPLALTGLALGVGGIFNAWTIFTGIKYFAYVGALISSILILTIITKIFRTLVCSRCVLLFFWQKICCKCG